VRTSVYRLAREGWLTASQDGRRSLYRLTGQGLARFEHAYRRIYAPPAQDWDGRWDIVFAPALEGRERRNLRKELHWEGFAAIAGGVFVRPARPGDPGALAAIFNAPGAQDRPAVICGRDAPGLKARSLQDYARECWRLASVAAEYRGFLARFEAVIRHFRDAARVDPERCFVVRSLLIHAFRRVTLHDPQLPLEMLPSHWPAPAAYALCRDFYRLTQRESEQHLRTTLATDGDPLPPAEPYFYRRFGGLKVR
jgi:phenylacetic acid degradation operon negative regulatory protein